MTRSITSILLCAAICAGVAQARHPNRRVREVSLSPSDYHTLLTVGDTVGDETFGLLKTVDGDIIYANNYDDGKQLDTPDISNAPDHFAIFELADGMYATAATDFYPPSTSYVMKLGADKNPVKNPELTVETMNSVDWSAWGGFWLPCSGQLHQSTKKSATIMNGEEYEPNDKVRNDGP
eukprot:gene2198-33754_t